MTFETSQRLDKQVEKHRKECKTRATAGEQFVWEFLPSGIIECQLVRFIDGIDETIDKVYAKPFDLRRNTPKDIIEILQ